MLAASEPGLVDQFLLLSYPLHPPQRPTELRTAHFPRLQPLRCSFTAREMGSALSMKW
jgi:predicted alpha/beta-hydrolase family hydrolase